MKKKTDKHTNTKIKYKKKTMVWMYRIEIGKFIKETH